MTEHRCRVAQWTTGNTGRHSLRDVIEHRQLDLINSPGATGVAECVEFFQRLCGDAGNQVDGARIALAHNNGGPTAVSMVTILKGPVPNGE